MALKASSARTFESRQLAPELESKESELRRLMHSMKKVLVAFSGGVDSSYLAVIAKQELSEHATAAIGLSPSVSMAQRSQAREFARLHGLNLKEVETSELEDPNYSANPNNRCFFCKSELYSKLIQVAGDDSIKYVLDGTNADDIQDIRPGRQAAEELGVRSPLAELGFTKADIRELSKRLRLQSWDQPSSPCLASRIAYGVPVTRGRLGQIETAESVLSELGFREFRVRAHGEIARIEISKAEMHGFLSPELFETVSEELKRCGFKYVTLDLEGFRSGSLN